MVIGGEGDGFNVVRIVVTGGDGEQRNFRNPDDGRAVAYVVGLVDDKLVHCIPIALRVKSDNTPPECGEVDEVGDDDARLVGDRGVTKTIW